MIKGKGAKIDDFGRIGIVRIKSTPHKKINIFFCFLFPFFVQCIKRGFILLADKSSVNIGNSECFAQCQKLNCVWQCASVFPFADSLIGYMYSFCCKQLCQLFLRNIFSSRVLAIISPIFKAVSSPPAAQRFTETPSFTMAFA